MIAPNKLLIGSSNEHIVLNSYSDNTTALLHLLQQAKRQILFFSVDLQPRASNTVASTDILGRFCRLSQYSEVKILLSDSKKAVKQGHRWIELSRKLSSKIHIHKVSENFSHLFHCYLVVDDTAVLYKPEADRYEGYANGNAPVDASNLKKKFLEAWEQSQPDPELQRLHL